MTNGFGAGFAAVGILASLVGITALLGAVSLLRVLLEESRSSLRRALGYVVGVLVFATLLVAGFGVAALFDELPVGAYLLVVAVFLPASASVLRLVRVHGQEFPNALLVSGVAWTWPYTAALVAFFAGVALVPEVLSLPQGEVRSYRVAWIAATVAGVVAVGGSVLLTDRVASRLVDT